MFIDLLIGSFAMYSSSLHVCEFSIYNISGKEKNKKPIKQKNITNLKNYYLKQIEKTEDKHLKFFKI